MLRSTRTHRGGLAALAIEVLKLSHRNSVNLYQRRYADMPRPVVDLGAGRVRSAAVARRERDGTVVATLAARPPARISPPSAPFPASLTSGALLRPSPVGRGCISGKSEGRTDRAAFVFVAMHERRPRSSILESECPPRAYPSCPDSRCPLIPWQILAAPGRLVGTSSRQQR